MLSIEPKMLSSCFAPFILSSLCHCVFKMFLSFLLNSNRWKNNNKWALSLLSSDNVIKSKQKEINWWTLIEFQFKLGWFHVHLPMPKHDIVVMRKTRGARARNKWIVLFQNEKVIHKTAWLSIANLIKSENYR